ncbi:hypothetical protein B0H13DRAFT_2508599, partial [Mycena leptocephala]
GPVQSAPVIQLLSNRFSVALETDLQEWNKIHQDAEEHLPNVLRGVVEKGVQIALDAIPNGTIPAEIFQGLVWMTVLCLNIPERKKAAYELAIQTADHLNAMADAFGTTHQMMILPNTNEICKWAYEQVTSKGAFDDQPQAEFKAKLDNATKSFLTISTIRTMHAISALDRGVVELLNYNERTARLERIKSKFGSFIATQYHYKDQYKRNAMKQLVPKPTLAHVFSLQQAEEIFLKPLSHLAKASPSDTLVVVIDGVDEFQPTAGKTRSSMYQEVTSVLGKVAAELPMNTRLGELPKLEVEGFPSTAQLDTLSDAAAGHLGWAAQALRWLVTEHQWFPNATLDEKIKAISQDAGGDLDQLYMFILSRSLPPENHRQRSFFVLQFQQLLRCLAVLEQPQPIHVICELIQSDGNFDVLKCLQQLSSIYAKGTEAVTLNTVPQPHKSFFDFITTRALEEFRIERATGHQELPPPAFVS